MTIEEFNAALSELLGELPEDERVVFDASDSLEDAATSLRMRVGVDVELEMSDETTAQLARMSASRGVSIDRVVRDLLKKMIEDEEKTDGDEEV